MDGADPAGIGHNTRLLNKAAHGKKRARILLADDDLEMLSATGKLLQTDFEGVDMVSDGHSLVEAALKIQPEVIVTNICMPKMNGLEAAGRFAVFCQRSSSFSLRGIALEDIDHNRMLLPNEFQRVYIYIADWNKAVGL